MQVRCYTIFDNKALIYQPPFFQPTDGAAIRLLTDAVADPNSSLSRHPGDYVLFYCGNYDDQKGAMLPVSPLVHVVDAIAVVRVQPDIFQHAPAPASNGIDLSKADGVTHG